MDGDGCDEITYGSAAINNDGTLLYSTGLGHGDAQHLGDHRFLLHHIPLWFDNEANDPGGASAPCRALWSELLTRAGFDCAFNGHTHSHQFYAKGQHGNPYPMYIGGGPSVGHACVYVLRVRGNEYSVDTILR